LDDEKFLTVHQIAELLKLNQETVRNMIDRGEIRAVRIDQRRVRIQRSALEEFIAAGETPPAQPGNEGVPAEPGANPDDWARLGAELADSSAALNSEDRATSRRRSVLTEVAKSLANALPDET